MSSRLFALTAAAVFAAAPAAPAAYVTVGTYSASGTNTVSGSNKALAGSAVIDYDAALQKLRITLTNTATTDVEAASDVLTGLFFRYGDGLTGQPTMTRDTAVTGLTSDAIYYPTAMAMLSHNGDVGGEWAAKPGLTVGGQANLFGVSAAAFGLFAAGDRFNANNLSNAADVGGLDWGLLPAADNTATGDAVVKNSGGLIRNAAVFEFIGVVAFDGTKVNDLMFQYGTALTDPRFGPAAEEPGGPSNNEMNPVPAPAGLALALAGAPLLALARRRRAGKAG